MHLCTQTLHMYDASRTLEVWVRSSELYQLIVDKGVLGTNQFTSKKVYVKVRIEHDDQGMLLHINTADISPHHKHTW
jgi:site-specific recombinase